MKVVLALVIFALCAAYIWRTCEAAYATNTNTRMRFKIVAMQRELVMDAMVKRASINWMKRYYDRSPVFQLAETVYGIRKKYLRMVFVYMRTLEYFDDFDYSIFLNYLTEIQHLGMQIDNMILAMEEWEDRSTRQKRIGRHGDAAVDPPPPNPAQMREARRVHQLKQREYVEKKKILDSMAQGSSRQKVRKQNFQRRNKMEEGFESDNINLYK